MCEFIPNYMTRHILEVGDERQQDAAIQTLRGDHQLRKAGLMAMLNEPKNDGVLAGRKRSTYTAENRTSLPGKLVRTEGATASGDASVDAAHDGAGATYDLFKEIFGRDSIDGKGMELISTVHYGRSYNNAHWNGTMVYGDGDGRIFRSFTLIDICSHELTHGITERTAGLRYRAQSGAINESMSDVFGVMVKQRVLNQTVEQADWLVGEGIFMPEINGRAIRDIANPGTAFDDPRIGRDRQIWHMKDYKDISEDNGGVHIFSAIGNKAFHVASMELGGYSWKVLGPVWYNALTTKLRSNSQFQDAANATLQAAAEIYGVDSKEQKAVKNGWLYVGVKT